MVLVSYAKIIAGLPQWDDIHGKVTQNNRLVGS